MGTIGKLIISTIIPQLAGGIGSLFTMDSVRTWYQTINKPSFNPPNWVFGPVWTTLFLLMGIALFLVWNKPDVSGKKLALSVFAVQLVLNIMWSLIFFGLHQPGWALVEIMVLWAAIVANIILFYPISKTAGLLLVPYLGWVSFAAVLNFFLWKMN